MHCLKCLKETLVKNGIVSGRQRYLCKNCHYSFTLFERGKPKDLKKLAMHLHLEGLPLRRIARMLNVSNVSILKWIREKGKTEGKTGQIPKQSVEVVDLDRMWNYLTKKYQESESGWLLIELPKGLLPQKKVIVSTKPR